MQLEVDMQLVRVETGDAIWHDVSMLSMEKRLIHKHLIYTKDKNGKRRQTNRGIIMDSNYSYRVSMCTMGL